MARISLAWENGCNPFVDEFDSRAGLVKKKRDNSPYSTWRMMKAIFWSCVIAAVFTVIILVVVHQACTSSWCRNH